MNWLIEEGMKRKQYTSNITQLEQEIDNQQELF